MRKCWIFALLCCVIPGCATPAGAVMGAMEKATVHAMRKVPCMDSPGGGRPGFGGGGGVPECTEYELRSAKVSYRIRPRRSILLLLGGDVSIKLAGDQLLLHSNESVKDIHCDVLEMWLNSEEDKREQEKAWERERDRSYNPQPCYSASGRETPC